MFCLWEEKKNICVRIAYHTKSNNELNRSNCLVINMCVLRTLAGIVCLCGFISFRFTFFFFFYYYCYYVVVSLSYKKWTAGERFRMKYVDYIIAATATTEALTKAHIDRRKHDRRKKTATKRNCWMQESIISIDSFGTELPIYWMLLDWIS